MYINIVYKYCVQCTRSRSFSCNDLGKCERCYKNATNAYDTPVLLLWIILWWSVSMFALQYLHETLKDFIKLVLDNQMSLDGNNTTSAAELQRKRDKLVEFCDIACYRIFNSLVHNHLPVYVTLYYWFNELLLIEWARRVSRHVKLWIIMDLSHN